MRRVQRDEAELSVHDAFDDLCSAGFGDIHVLLMTPPDDDIRGVERRRVESLLRRVEARRFCDDPGLLG